MGTYGSDIGSGKDWECICQIALVLRCYEASYNPVAHKLLCLPDKFCPKTVYVTECPPKNLEEAKTWWNEHRTQMQMETYPYVSVLLPQSSKFAVFDALLIYQRSSSGPQTIVGFQMKLGKETASDDVPVGVHGVWLRGDAPNITWTQRKWKYATKDEI